MKRPKTFPKSDRLCHRDEIQQLFDNGQSLFSFPLKMLYTCPGTEAGDKSTVKAAFSVSKKRHRKASSRNLIKRRMREAYRLHKGEFLTQLPQGHELHMMFIYVSPGLERYQQVETAMKDCLDKYAAQVNKARS